ncbi:MAG: gliding motility protein GldL [Crocinitomicaceae bacterium]|nr:gliding motility protein GldL [Crocinitomicaceae bacterium]
MKPAKGDSPEPATPMAKNKKSPAVGGTKKKAFNESKAWKSGMAKLYGIGASIVIIGALFKIEHWEGASEMLIIGLGTEAFIFLMSAFERPHAEPKWELVYPELAVEDGEPAAKKPVDQLDDMLQDAGVDNAVLSRLGDGMRHLGDQAMQLSEVTDAAAATSEYGGALRTATEKVNGLTDTYTQVSDSLTGLSENKEMSIAAGEQLQKMNDNLGSLNGMYEAQLQQMETSRQLFAGMSDLVQNLNESLEDTKKYKDNIAALSTNMEALNTVYANMLNAMGNSRG